MNATTHRSPSSPVRRLAIGVGAVIMLATIATGTSTAIGLVAREKLTEPFTINGTVRHVVINMDAGSVVLRGTSADGVTGTRRIERSYRAPTYSEKLDGDTLTITASCPNVFLGNFCSVVYELAVPADVTVQAVSDGGNIISNAVTGDLDLSSSAGGIDVTGAKGRLQLSSSAGNVDVNNSRSPEVNAHSSAGDVRIELLDAPTKIEADSSAGSVAVIVPRTPGGYRVDASTSAGSESVEVDTSATSQRTISVESSAGNVDVLYGLAAS